MSKLLRFYDAWKRDDDQEMVENLSNCTSQNGKLTRSKSLTLIGGWSGNLKYGLDVRGNMKTARRSHNIWENVRNNYAVAAHKK